MRNKYQVIEATYRLIAVFLLLSTLCISVQAEESTSPPHPLSTFGLAKRLLVKLLHNSHYRIIGSCTWLTKRFPPKMMATPAIEQFLPDLIVTVSKKPEENPWLEARWFYENSATRKFYQTLYHQTMGLDLGFGDDSGQATRMHINDDHSYVVDVFGSPASLYQLPFVSHRPETGFGLPYYLSEADALIDRSETAEILYMATHPQLLISHEIGTTTAHWGSEIPRLMRVTQVTPFRAAVVVAMHAADIVTNQNGLHVTRSTTNSCGNNCLIANVVYESSPKNIIWQELYPINRNITPGQSDDFGIDDDRAGNGNYIFAVWRKYRGCVAHSGKLLKFLSFPHVASPKKR